MFGYVRPVTTELKVKELDMFKSCYCGLCHVMGKKFGFTSRFLLNYDFVFLTMLLWNKNDPIELEGKRCAACPFKKKQCCKPNAALEKAAAMSVILSWWKIQDEIRDEGFVKSLVYRGAALLLRKAYSKAAKEFAEFDAAVRNNLEELTRLEKENCSYLDAVADRFARILSCAAVTGDKIKDRILEQVLYHTGRWIYIIDAADDFDNDIRSGSYNAVSARFGSSDTLGEEEKARLELTLMQSRNMAGNSFELLDETPWSDTVRNIIALGMPGVTEAVLSGVWKNRNRLRKLKDWN